jgi:regulator of cell morphogenesis and NO signaling
MMTSGNGSSFYLCLKYLMRMTGNISVSAETRMADAVAENPFLLLLLEHFGISLPLQEKTAGELAAENGIGSELFLTFINLYGDLNHSFDVPFSGDEVPAILKYLKNSHQYYTDEVYPGIMDMIRMINSTSSSEETMMIEKFFLEYLAEVRNHFDYEEHTVFPYIIRLHQSLSGEALKQEQGRYSVDEYKEHHDDIEEKLDDLKSLLTGYLPLKEGIRMRRKLLFILYELEHDLKIHSRIEDYILIPLVAAMEARLKTTS